MIVYMPDPLGYFTKAENLPRVRIKLSSGGHLNAECLDVDQVRILSIESTDPMDFLNQRYQPGSIIELKPGI